MKLSQVLLKRKPEAHLKPQSFVRNWQWHNSWQIQRERSVTNHGFKEALIERGVAIDNAEDLFTPICPSDLEVVDLVETIEKKLPKDENHPLWQDEPAYSYTNRTYQPKGQQMEFALALTNSVGVSELPDRVTETKDKIGDVSPTLSESIQRIIKTCFVGDATQKVLPKHPAVPFIGWHPVESKMRPRDQYDWKAMSWGRNPPRTYGIPTKRRNQNITRAIFNEIRKSSGQSWSRSFSENDMHRQFVNSADGKLLRFHIPTTFSLLSSTPMEPYADAKMVADTKAALLPDVSPQLPVAGLWPTNIYRPESNHPITSLDHSHPFVHTVLDHDNDHTKRGFQTWSEDHAKSRGLIMAFTVALGQARLRFGDNVKGVLPQPVCINMVTTNGLQYQLSALQLNTLDLGSEGSKNIFWSHNKTLSLLEFCGYDAAQVSLQGYDPEVFNYLTAFYLQDHVE